ncbi:MAG: TetR/AcrR family transcriptional regulator, partial [Gordonia amarae]
AAQHHFPTREALVTATLEQIFADLTAVTSKSAEPAGDRIAAVVDRAVDLYTGKEFKAALQVWAAAASDPALRELILPLEAKFARAAHRMTVQALGASDDEQRIHRVAQLTLDLARGLGLADTLSDDSKRRAQVVATYVDMVRSALGE